MKRKQFLLIYLLICVGVTSLYLSSCNKDGVEKGGKPVLTTRKITGITCYSAKTGGNILTDGGAPITARGVCWSKSLTPTISDNITIESDGIYNFESTLNGLAANTVYYVRAYATNSNGTSYGVTMSFSTHSLDSAGLYVDLRDGNVYKYVTIGDQVWLAENLRYLPSVSHPATGSVDSQHFYVYDYYGASVSAAKALFNYSTFGVLYNWAAAMDGEFPSSATPSGVQGVCPTGWHLPSDGEWKQLIFNLGDSSIAANKLKDTTFWSYPYHVGYNETGFSALPGGMRIQGDTFLFMYNSGSWWSATEFYSDYRWFRYMLSGNSEVYRSYENKEVGFSVRCVRD